MSEYAFVVIDGTGDWSDQTYAKSMSHSFCWQIKRQLSHRCSYKRGPSVEGYRMNERGVWAADAIGEFSRRGIKRLFLAGYSRGAVAVVMASEELYKRKIDIEGMFLFDPVARHLSAGGEIIPPNVKSVRIARRTYTDKMVDKYDHTIGTDYPLFGRFLYHNPIRTSFGFATLRYHGVGGAVEQKFTGSHGALGGVGWKHVTEDFDCVRKVAHFMQAGFRHHHLAIKLTPFQPASVPP